MVTNAQVRKMMQEFSKDGNLSRAAMLADMDRKTARKYRDSGRLPSEAKAPRHWQTRNNPFSEHWDEIVQMLEGAPELEALSLFECLCRKYPHTYNDGQLRTLQRHVRRWRAQQGPQREVFFAQQHQPGEAFQTDWTDAKELGVTIGGAPFGHLICHVMLPFSNWEWGAVCGSESLLSLRTALRATVLRLGHVPIYHQTDNSSAATHRVRGSRDFNVDYLQLLAHYGLKPRVTKVGAKEQNGDVESSHRHLKRRLKQRLLLRGSSDFESAESYEQWLYTAFDAFNERRREQLQQELPHLHPFNGDPLPVFLEKRVRVNKGSIITLMGRTYSVPSRLIGHTVHARIYEQHIEVRYEQSLQLTCERLTGSKYSRIDYRHIIWSLVRKPAAFSRTSNQGANDN